MQGDRWIIYRWHPRHHAAVSQHWLANGLSPVRRRASPEAMLTYCELEPQDQKSVKFESKRDFFSFWEKACENIVCKTSAILFSPPCIDQPQWHEQCQVGCCRGLLLRCPLISSNRAMTSDDLDLNIWGLIAKLSSYWATWPGFSGVWFC